MNYIIYKIIYIIYLHYLLTEPKSHFLYRTRSLLFLSCSPNYKYRRLAFEFCLLLQDNMRGKFTWGSPQELLHQVSLHSETKQMRRASNSSSTTMRRNA